MKESEQYIGAKIEDCAEEVIAESPDKNEGVEELIQKKAEKLAEEMRNKYAELTGQNDKYDQEGLYRNMIREVLLNYKFITPEQDQKLKEKYKQDGKIESLDDAGDKIEKFKDNSSNDTPKKDAIEMEEIIIPAVRYAQDGWVSTTYFFTQLHGYLENEALRKKRAQLETPIQKKMDEPTEANINNVKKKADEEKYAVFDKMVNSRRNAYATEKQKQIETNFIEWKSAGQTTKEIFKKFNGDPIISKDLNDVLTEYRDFNLDLKGIAHLKTEATIRHAELSGLHHF